MERQTEVLPAISIHALREEGDGGSNGGDAKKEIFLSTPSARRATMRCFSCNMA